MIWYSFTPVDTLFFKGAVMAEKGEDHNAVSIFPPTPHTISGALRTTILRQNGISIDEFKNGRFPKNIMESVGKPGSSSPFNVIGPFLREENNLYIPTPFTWFVDKYLTNDNIYVASKLKSTLLVFPREKKFWAKGLDSELENVGGNWIRIDKMLHPKRSYILPNDHFFISEIRTGNALQTNRRVHEGRLYSFTHIRLKENIALVFGVNMDLPLADTGILTLGGEQRFGRYSKIKPVQITHGSSELYMSLTLTKAQKEYESSLIATGKLIYRGGWDLHKGFHKPMEAYFPSGSVFDTKIEDNMIEL